MLSNNNIMIKLGIVIYLLTFCIEGALRYVLYLGHAEWMIYLRDVILIIILALLLPRYIHPKLDLFVVTVLYLLLFHCFVAILFISNAAQIAFGVKLFLPFLLGMFAYHDVCEFSRITKVVLGFFLLTVSGIFLNNFVSFPWEGLSYGIGGQEIQASLKWWATDGSKRVAGFARSSYDAAAYTLLSAIFLSVYLRAYWLRVVVWLTAGLAILLTTTKGLMLVYAFLSIFLIYRGLLSSAGIQIFQYALWAPMLFMILAPAFSGLFLFKIDWKDPVQGFLLSSYIDRLENTWPQAFANIDRYGSYILGRGIGGIGTAQRYYEPLIYNYADNLFVYMYTNFGVLAVGYLVYLMIKIQNLKIRLERDAVFFGIAATILIYGITTAVLESPSIAFLAGLMLVHLSRLEVEPLLGSRQVVGRVSAI
jgi:hypothetical protein